MICKGGMTRDLVCTCNRTELVICSLINECKSEWHMTSVAPVIEQKKFEKFPLFLFYLMNFHGFKCRYHVFMLSKIRYKHVHATRCIWGKDFQREIKWFENNHLFVILCCNFLKHLVCNCH